MKRWAFFFAVCATLSAQVKLPPFTRETFAQRAAVYTCRRPACRW